MKRIILSSGLLFVSLLGEARAAALGGFHCKVKYTAGPTQVSVELVKRSLLASVVVVADGETAVFKGVVSVKEEGPLTRLGGHVTHTVDLGENGWLRVTARPDEEVLMANGFGWISLNSPEIALEGGLRCTALEAGR